MSGPPDNERRPSAGTEATSAFGGAVTGYPKAPARARADLIKRLIIRMADDRDRVLSLVVEAYEVRDWRALGYASWKDYVTSEFGTVLQRLARDDRRDVVLLLTHTGMSTRAIAPVLGVGKSTVDRDASGVPSGTPDVGVGVDNEDHVDDEDDDLRLDDALAAIHRITSVVPAVTGLDGKTYTRTEAPPRRRTKYADSYRDATYRIDQDVRRLSRLHGDDRWARTINTGTLTRFVDDVRRARDELDRLLAQVDAQPIQGQVIEK